MCTMHNGNALNEEILIRVCIVYYHEISIAVYNDYAMELTSAWCVKNSP